MALVVEMKLFGPMSLNLFIVHSESRIFLFFHYSVHRSGSPDWSTASNDTAQLTANPTQKAVFITLCTS